MYQEVSLHRASFAQVSPYESILEYLFLLVCKLLTNFKIKSHLFYIIVKNLNYSTILIIIKSTNIVIVTIIYLGPR
jgi:hypothetical protein